MGAVGAARNFKARAGRPSAAGMAPIFYSRTTMMRGRLNRPIAGMVSIPIDPKQFTPSHRGPSGSEVGGGSNPAMTWDIKHMNEVCTAFVQVPYLARIGQVRKTGSQRGWV
jgi:hypothetical protein